MRGFRLFIFPLLFTILLTSMPGCAFKSSRYIGVMSYRHQTVYLQNKKHYRVGPLPEGWRQIEARARAITFYNDAYRSSITTDAFCQKSFADSPLDTLAGELTSVLSDRTNISAKEMMLDGRGALRVLETGKMDGVPILMDVVVSKKDACNFDFVAVMPPDVSDDVERDFETFFNGFHY